MSQWIGHVLALVKCWRTGHCQLANLPDTGFLLAMCQVKSTALTRCSVMSFLACHVMWIPRFSLRSITPPNVRLIWSFTSTLCESKNAMLGMSMDNAYIIELKAFISLLSQPSLLWTLRTLLKINLVWGCIRHVRRNRSHTKSARTLALSPWQDKSLTPDDIITVLQMENSGSKLNTSTSRLLSFFMQRMLLTLLNEDTGVDDKIESVRRRQRSCVPAGTAVGDR